jgi:hypothetical protein
MVSVWVLFGLLWGYGFPVMFYSVPYLKTAIFLCLRQIYISSILYIYTYIYSAIVDSSKCQPLSSPSLFDKESPVSFFPDTSHSEPTLQRVCKESLSFPVYSRYPCISSQSTRYLLYRFLSLEYLAAVN